jgi:hypothetical protein
VFEYSRLLSGGGTLPLSGNPLSAPDLVRVSVIRVRFLAEPEVKGNVSNENVSSSFESQVFIRTADPNGLAGSTDPNCA